MRAVLAAMLVCLPAACGFEDATQPLPELQIDAGPIAAPQSDAGALAPPVPDPIATSVCTTSVAVQGTAPAGSNIIVFGGAVSALSTSAHPSTGRFCLDVELVPDAVNNLRLQAQDPVLGLSSSVTVKVTQDSNCTDDTSAPAVDPPKSKNVALGSTVTAEDDPKEGNASLLTDGDDKTYVKYALSCSWYNPKCPFDPYNGWVHVKLDKLYEIDRIVVRWKDSSGDYGKEYKVLVSAMSDPDEPDPKAGYWTKVAEVDHGDGGTDTFDLGASKVYAQYVALWLEFDGAQSAGESFSIAELEVWNVPQQSGATLPVTGNTCSTLGAGQ